MRKNFTIFKTEEKAERFCRSENAFSGLFSRIFRKAHYAPWSSPDGSDTGFICWYWE